MKKYLQKISVKGTIDATKKSTKKFKDEFKKASGTAIIAAFGLIVALAWKEVIEEYILRFSNVLQGKIISAVIITAVSVIGIMIITKIVQNSNGETKTN